MALREHMQALLDEAFQGKIKLTAAYNSPNGAEGRTGEWIILMERYQSKDLLPVWRLMMKRQQEYGKPVLAVLLDEESASTEGPIQLEAGEEPFPGLVIYRFGTDSPEVLRLAASISQLYRIH